MTYKSNTKSVLTTSRTEEARFLPCRQIVIPIRFCLRKLLQPISPMIRLNFFFYHRNHHKTVFFSCQTSIIANLNSTFCQRHLTSSGLANVSFHSRDSDHSCCCLGEVAGCEKKKSSLHACSLGRALKGLE